MKKLIFTLLVSILMIGNAFSQSIHTSLSSIYSYPGQDIVVPVTVSNFNGVASISLVLAYNPNVLSFTGVQNVNSNLSGSFITNSMPGNNEQLLYLSWFALVPTNIGNGVLLELKFNYSGGSTNLTWDTLTFGNCQYANLMGDPLPAVFSNGTVNTVNPNMTYSPQITAIPSTDVLIPITVASFNNIAQIHLSLNHDHSVLNFQALEYANPLITSSTIGVTNGGNIVHINWQSSQAVNVGDDTLFILRFHYNGGISVMDWDTLSSDSCFYKDGNGNVLPGTFVGGAIQPALVQVGISSASICNGGDVTLPISLAGANNIKSFTLKLNYNNTVSSFISCLNLNSELSSGVFTFNDYNGVLQINWNSTQPINLGNTTLCELKFHSNVNNGGISDMSWDNTFCEIRNPEGLNFPLNLVGGSLMVTPFLSLGADQEVCNYHTTTLFAGALFASYLWSTGDTTSSIVVDSTMGSGIYSVTVTDVNGCTGYDEIVLNFMPCIGINEVESVSPIMNIYPNPVTEGVFTLNLQHVNEVSGLSIFDLTGRVVDHRDINPSHGNDFTDAIHIHLSKGIYILKVQTPEKILSERLIVE